MNTPAGLQKLEAASDIAVAELAAIPSSPARGGARWDPFRCMPEVRLSSAAQGQLLSVAAEALTAVEAAEQRLRRARSEAGRSRASRDVYQMESVAAWAKEMLLASVSLLLVRRVDLALKRHHRSHAESADEYMAEALSCALGCVRTCPSDAKFHLYVASSVDAALATKSLEGLVAESMTDAEQIVLRHLPSVVSRLRETLGREPRDPEVADAMLARARGWAEARIVEKGGEVDADVLRELVDAKLTKQGMFSALRNIVGIRVALQGTVSLDQGIDGDGAVPYLGVVPGADAELEERGGHAALASLLRPMPFVSEDLEVPESRMGDARTLLQSRLWHTLALGDGLPVEQCRVSRRAPDILAQVVA